MSAHRLEATEFTAYGHELWVGIGCNLSHQEVLRRFLADESGPGWCLMQSALDLRSRLQCQGALPMLQIVRYHKGGPEGPHGCCLSRLRSSASIAVLEDDATLDMPGIDARELFNAGMQVIQKESPNWVLVFLGGSLASHSFH